MRVVEFLLARIAEEEWWAREASRDYKTYVEAGVHWHWVLAETDDVARLDPLLEGFVGEDVDEFRVDLRSVEEFPCSTGTLPQFAIPSAEEVPVAVAGHIVRHDPARVLAECAAKRAIMENHLRHEPGQHGYGASRFAVVVLAAVYADHPDFNPEWSLS